MPNHHHMETYISGGEAPHILNVGTKSMSAVSLTLRPHYCQGSNLWPHREGDWVVPEPVWKLRWWEES